LENFVYNNASSVMSCKEFFSEQVIVFFTENDYVVGYIVVYDCR